MEGDPTAPPAEGVGLVAALAKRAGTLSLLKQERTQLQLNSSVKNKKDLRIVELRNIFNKN